MKLLTATLKQIIELSKQKVGNKIVLIFKSMSEMKAEAQPSIDLNGLLEEVKPANMRKKASTISERKPRKKSTEVSVLATVKDSPSTNRRKLAVGTYQQPSKGAGREEELETLESHNKSEKSLSGRKSERGLEPHSSPHSQKEDTQDILQFLKQISTPENGIVTEQEERERRHTMKYASFFSKLLKICNSFFQEETREQRSDSSFAKKFFTRCV